MWIFVYIGKLYLYCNTLLLTKLFICTLVRISLVHITVNMCISYMHLCTSDQYLKT